MFKAIQYQPTYLKSFKICLEIYELDPAHILSAPGLAWQAAVKKTEVKLVLLTDIYKLLMEKKGIRCRLCHCIYAYVKANSKYLKAYTGNKESSYVKYWNVDHLYGQTLSQKLPVNDLTWVKNRSRFNGGFIKNYNEESDIE